MLCRALLCWQGRLQQWQRAARQTIMPVRSTELDSVAVLQALSPGGELQNIQPGRAAGTAACKAPPACQVQPHGVSWRYCPQCSCPHMVPGTRHAGTLPRRSPALPFAVTTLLSSPYQLCITGPTSSRPSPANLAVLTVSTLLDFSTSSWHSRSPRALSTAAVRDFTGIWGGAGRQAAG